MQDKLGTVAHWIPPIPSNVFKLGLLLEIHPQTLWLMDKKEDKFFLKIYEILMLGYSLHGDDFPAKLYKAMETMGILGLYTRSIELHNLQDPFLLPKSPSFCMPEKGQLPLEHYVSQISLEIACFLAPEPAIDIMCALHFEMPPSQFTTESCMQLRLFDIFTQAHRKLSTADFLRQLKLLMNYVGSFMCFQEVCCKFEIPQAAFSHMF